MTDRLKVQTIKQSTRSALFNLSVICSSLTLSLTPLQQPKRIVTISGHITESTVFFKEVPSSIGFLRLHSQVTEYFPITALTPNSVLFLDPSSTWYEVFATQKIFKS